MKKRVLSVLCMVALIVASAVFPMTAGAETVSPNDDDVLKVLAIGNSFSRNALAFFNDFAEAAGVDVVSANLYFAGCSLSTHWYNADGNRGAYEYNKGSETTMNVSILTALEDENWDYVVLQQASPDSGTWSTYSPYLLNLSNYVTANEPDATQIICQTWAYEPYVSATANKNAFEKYGGTTNSMFRYIRSAYNKAANLLDVDLIPAGYAMQLARAKAEFDYNNGGNRLCSSDGYHAGVYGEYLIGATWFEKMSGLDVSQNTYVNPDVAELSQLLKDIAHTAVSEFEVVDAIGDIDGINDGFGARDVITLMRHIAQWQDYEAINKAQADVDGNGDVDAIDVIYMKRVLANWSGYKLEF